MSHPSRPKRSAKDAVDTVATSLLRGRCQVIDADLSGDENRDRPRFSLQELDEAEPEPFWIQSVP